MTPKPRPRTPAEFLQKLPEPEIGATELEQDEDLRTVELGRSVLAVAGLTHKSELTAILELVERASEERDE